MKTFTATPADIDKKWIIIDAEGVVLGRLASIIARSEEHTSELQSR